MGGGWFGPSESRRKGRRERKKKMVRRINKKYYSVTLGQEFILSLYSLEPKKLRKFYSQAENADGKPLFVWS